MTLPIQTGVTVVCGPECRHATRLTRPAGEWVWCALRGEPRITGPQADDCPYFAASDAFAGSSPLAAVLYSTRSATDQLPHEN